ncbi:MAG: inorganic phosphate transporter [Planctomycetes bacterium]|nr:inorganic phosphate transporter [Planctomycetota bacterium]
MVSLLITVIVAALIFDYINGFHDAANAIATVVSTGVLPMRTAVLLAGILNIFGAFHSTAVAQTIAKGLAADPAAVTQQMVLAAVIGAIVWNLVTWWYGIPSSSSHALVGGLLGAVVGALGPAAFQWGGLTKKVLIPLVFSPVMGFLLALLLMIGLLWIVRRVRPEAVNAGSRRLQLLSACGMAFSHGSNDAQKSMGIITLALLAWTRSGADGMPQWMMPVDDHTVPDWVVWACALAIGFGTMAGGKRIIKTMGTKIIRISPLQGFAAETSGTAVILIASHWGLPLSTTHCINACIMGVGASKRLSAVRWGVAGNIIAAWVLTIPLSAFFAYLSLLAIHAMFGR